MEELDTHLSFASSKIHGLWGLVEMVNDSQRKKNNSDLSLNEDPVRQTSYYFANL